jgi:transcriptional regulator with XRE-family HTH domain
MATLIPGAVSMTFAEKLRELRGAVRLSEARLAETAGLTFASVHSYGLGRRKPSFAAVVKMARALGVTCEAFANCQDLQDELPRRRRKKR